MFCSFLLSLLKSQMGHLNYTGVHMAVIRSKAGLFMSVDVCVCVYETTKEINIQKNLKSLEIMIVLITTSRSLSNDKRLH